MRPLRSSPADYVMQAPLESTPNPQNKLPNFQFAKQGNQGSRKTTQRRSLHAGKHPNGVLWKNLSRRYLPSSPPAGNSAFLELAKGIEPPTL
jgi:hypothetical protein